MPKFLMIDGVESNWRLPATTDLDALRHNLHTAMTHEQTVEVPVELHDDPTNQTIALVNCRNVRVVAAVELPEQGHGIAQF